MHAKIIEKCSCLDGIEKRQKKDSTQREREERERERWMGRE
jgi:hypothetical protein